MLTRPILLYDGACGFCGRWVNRLRRWDRARRIDYVPYQNRVPLAGIPPIADVALERAMHLVAPDGSVRAGARALAGTFGYLPGGRPLEWLLLLPPVSWVADRVYAWIAANRRRLSGSSPACGLEPPTSDSAATSPERH